MKNLTRRRFLKGSASTLGLLSASGLLQPELVYASGDGNGKLAFFVDLAGGHDGFQVFPYAAGDIYTRLRTSLRPQIAIDGATVRVMHSQSGNVIGFNPALGKILTEATNHLTLVLKNGITIDPGRSHETSQNYYSTGVFSASPSTTTGWLARLVDYHGLRSDQVYGIATGQLIDFESQTNRPLVFSRLSDYSYVNRGFGTHTCVTNCTGLSDRVSSSGDDTLLARSIIKQLREQQPKNTNLEKGFADVDRLIEDTEVTVRTRIATQVTTGNYLNSTGGLSTFAAACQDAARIVRYAKSGGELQNKSLVFRLRRGDFDMHSGMNSRMTANLTDVDNALSGLIQDLKAAGVWNDSVIMVYSEFGRTTRQNSIEASTAGTDHAWGNTHLIMGGSVQNAIRGEHPTLTELDTRNYLTPTVSHLSPFKQILSWIGFDPAPVFPETLPGDVPLNIFA